MRTKLFLTFIVAILASQISAQINLSKSDRQENLRLLLKDTSTLSAIQRGNFSHPALEIAVKTPVYSSTTKNYPIRIAIDPGHVASTKKEALIEDRYINSKHGFFYESELNMATALELKKLLTERGFLVMITREEGKTAFGYSYETWYKKHFKEELKADLANEVITQDLYESLSRATKKEVFHKYFKNKDFLKRIELINAFQPDITLIIHYNSSEFVNDPKIYAPEVDYNYSVSFVPGGFTNSEIKFESQLNDFIRLASTDVIKQSVQLSSFINQEFSTKLGSPSLLPEKFPDLWYLQRYSVYSNEPGVFARNMPLTRCIKSPLCYGESLLQNNKDEIIRLSKKDYRVGRYRVPYRVRDVADCYYTGIFKYFKSIGKL